MPSWDASWPAIAAIIPARDEAGCVGETIASLLRQNYRGRVQRDRGRRPEPRRHGGGRAQSRGGARRRRSPHSVARARVAGGLDGQAVGAAPGRRACREGAASADLFAVHRRRYRLRPGCAVAPCRAGASGRFRPHLADGEAALREPRRAHVRPGVHLLLPDALPVLLGERSAPRHRRGGGRLHAGAPRRAARGRRHGSDPRRLDRRLRAGAKCSRRTARSGSA